MPGPKLTPTERAIYDAARAEAIADRWRIDAEISERRGESSEIARGYQKQYATEAAGHWRRLAASKERKHALEGLT